VQLLESPAAQQGLRVLGLGLGLHVLLSEGTCLSKNALICPSGKRAHEAVGGLAV